MQTIKVLGISGSLRKSSYNTALLHAAKQLLPKGMELDLYDIATIPLYNGDVEAKGDPDPVKTFKWAIESSDALLIASPEYNYSVPGVLKNAIDWASRSKEGSANPDGKSVLFGKAAAIMGASTSKFGTARGQQHLRQILMYNGMMAVTSVEVQLTDAQNSIDENGKVTDAATRDFIRNLLEALDELTRKLMLHPEKEKAS